jgi:hypothetical protein
MARYRVGIGLRERSVEKMYKGYDYGTDAYMTDIYGSQFENRILFLHTDP